MVRLLSLLLLITATSVQAQYYVPCPVNTVQPRTGKVLSAITAASAANTLNTERAISLNQIITKVSINGHQGNYTFTRVIDSMLMFMPVLGSSTQTIALRFDIINLTALTEVGTILYYNDSMKSNGSSYLTSSVTLPTVATLMHQAFWTPTWVPKPANIPVDIGSSTTGSAPFVLSIRRSGGISSTVPASIQMYQPSYVPQYSIDTGSDGFWVNSNFEGTQYFIKNKVTILSSVRTLADFSPGNVWVFKTGNAVYSVGNRATRFVSVGYGLSEAQANSLDNAITTSK